MSVNFARMMTFMSKMCKGSILLIISYKIKNNK